MMGRTLAAVALLALLAPLVPAASDAPRAFSGEATFCHTLHTFDVRPGGLCPRVAQQGTLAPGGCEGGACVLLVTVHAEGAGVPALRKTLTVDAMLDDALVGAPLCEATVEDAALSCGAAAVLVSLPLADGACGFLRVGSTFREAADVPPTLPIRAENGFQACRAGAVLTLE